MALSGETGIVVALAWLSSRPGRYTRAVVLHDHLRRRLGGGPERAGRHRPAGAGPVAGVVVHTVRRFDAARLRTWTVRAAMRWATFTDRAGRGRGRAESVVGLLAAPLAVPAGVLVAVLAGAAVLAVVLVEAAVWGLCAAGRSVRSLVHRPARAPVPSSFDWKSP